MNMGLCAPVFPGVVEGLRTLARIGVPLACDAIVESLVEAATLVAQSRAATPVDART